MECHKPLDRGELAGISATRRSVRWGGIDIYRLDQRMVVEWWRNGDAGPRRAIWSRNDPVTVLGAWKDASGQQELNDLFADLADSFSDCTSYELELLEAEVRGDIAYTVGFEHTSASVNGVPRTYTLRWIPSWDGPGDRANGGDVTQAPGVTVPRAHRCN